MEEQYLEEAWHWFAMLEKISLREKEELLSHGLSPEQLYLCKHQEQLKAVLAEVGFCPTERNLEERILERLLSQSQKEAAKQSCNNLKNTGIQMVTRKSADYPEKLKQLAQPPITLYFYGTLPEKEVPSIAVVGARSCSVYGEELAAHFAARLSEAGIQIISGLARGIDASAGKAAISKKGSAYAVLGCGVDVCYPRENRLLYEQHRQYGGILSEEIPGSEPCAYRFPKRNRIISALSDGVLIVEAREKSGSLITAEFALEQGKEVYAIPGRIYDHLSAGCNRLIQAGAKLVSEPEDIILDFAERLNYKTKMKNEQVLLETKEKIVYASLSLQPKHVGQIAQETGLGLPELSCVLFQLEMKHYVKQSIKNFYIRNIKETARKN